jgi:hypothetical protein
MHRSLVRSLLSAGLTACFALSVLAWGGMPTCAVADPGGTAAGTEHAAHRGDVSHRHSHGQHGAPGGRVCLVHLCCAHLALQPSTPSSAGRLAVISADSGFAAVPVVGGSRPPHSLPFAHAPPARSA